MNAPGGAPLSEAAQLAATFDTERLTRELADVTSHRWRHQRIHAAGGSTGPAAAIDWRVLPLRSPGGDPDRTDPGGPGPTDFAPTAWLEHLPYLRGILATIPAPLNAVRLMALGPGAAAQPHRDPKYALHRGLVRLHLPIVTHPDAVLILDGVQHCWAAGQFWYGDFSREHTVANTSPITRIHTVIDALLTEELTSWFPPDWHTALTTGDVLLNHPTPATSLRPLTLPYPVLLPAGFTDFDHDRPLEGALQPAQITESAGQTSLTTGPRVFALVPVGPQEYRFAGWSEQRTLHLATGGDVTMRARHGRTLTEHHVPNTSHPL